MNRSLLLCLAFVSFLSLPVFGQGPLNKEPKTPLTLNIRDFGATGDGKTKDTAAIQQAIDRCFPG